MAISLPRTVLPSFPPKQFYPSGLAHIMTHFFIAPSLTSLSFCTFNSLIIWMIYVTIQLATDGLASVSLECNLSCIAI